ncbi:hypothetical protein M422DRAFT_259561 [Sphaerobolus stellatus SS14]|uniref:Uncharacterized protein n=1 Tax=Sphaerobolus stellatus (strain SS14) TaxID=990650 RepID=A0A0C9USX8_SPHS4|nr:hypothetical protein M422DRAFT_259561 [Sphaerobolus stellatus SS14]
MIKRIVKNIPNLKRIMFRLDYNSSSIIPLLKPLQHLSAIDLINPTKPIITDPIKDMWTEPAIKAARQVLKGPEGQRRLGMMYIWQEKVNELANVEANWPFRCWSWKERRVELSVVSDQ